MEFEDLKETFSLRSKVLISSHPNLDLLPTTSVNKSFSYSQGSSLWQLSINSLSVSSRQRFLHFLFLSSFTQFFVTEIANHPVVKSYFKSTEFRNVNPPMAFPEPSPPTWSIFFHFHAIFGETFYDIIGLFTPLLWGWRPRNPPRNLGSATTLPPVYFQ